MLKARVLLITGILLLISNASSAQTNSDLGVKISIGSFITLRTIDLGVTEFGLGSNQLREVHFIGKAIAVKGPVKFGTWHGVGTAATTLAMWKLKDTKWFIKYPAYIGINGFSAWVVGNNIKELRK